MTTTMWAQGMLIDSNIIQEHFKVSNSRQNCTSHVKASCLNLDNEYEREVSLFSTPITKKKFAFFISSRNLKNENSSNMCLKYSEFGRHHRCRIV